MTANAWTGEGRQHWESVHVCPNFRRVIALSRNGERQLLMFRSVMHFAHVCADEFARNHRSRAKMTLEAEWTRGEGGQPKC